MPRFSILVVLLLLVSSSTFAGVPGLRWGVGLSGNGAPCQFRFRADGSLDHLIVSITARDIFEVPVPFCSTSASITAGPGTLALCTCSPNPQTLITDALGMGTFEFAHIGGRGTGEVCITGHCFGDIGITCLEFDFTSSDLDASCETATSATSVIDLGIWAGCLPPGPYCEASDYNCDGTVNVIDLGAWAGGLGFSCGP